jgi:hypothetical protein
LEWAQAYWGDERFFLVATKKESAFGGGCWSNEIASSLPICQVYENVRCFFYRIRRVIKLLLDIY